MLEIAAKENRRIGHELHDNIQQQLTGLGLLATNLSEALERESAEQADLASRLARGIKEVAYHAHLLARGLVPVDVEAEGLRAALTEMASRISEQHGIQCDFRCEGVVKVSDNFAATHLYRIAQEAINNATKHAQAERIDISLTGTDGRLTLKVRDDGIGVVDQGSGMGFRIMKYRADLIGASIQIGPRKERGTQVVCTVLGER